MQRKTDIKMSLNAASQYYIGIDGGGTKTALCAASLNDALPRYSKTSGSSWREYGISGVAQLLKDAVDSLMEAKPDQIGGIVMGLPGYGESEEGDCALEREIQNTFAPIPVYITNDVEAGWAGSLALEAGINVVAGTGSIAFGKDSYGKTVRCGGWSALFGDEGSCYWIGRKVMELFSKQFDGRIPKDELYSIVRRELDLKNDTSFIDLMHNEYLVKRKQAASLQLLAEKAALAGSPSAKALYSEAVRELLLLATAVRSQLVFNENTWKVSYSGGLFKAEELVLMQFTREIEKSGGMVCSPRFEPVEGAVLLAFQHFYSDGLDEIQKILRKEKLNQ